MLKIMKFLIFIALIACAYCTLDGLEIAGQVLVNFTCLKQTYSWMLMTASDEKGVIDPSAIPNIKNATAAGAHIVDIVINPCKDCQGFSQITNLITALSVFNTTFRAYFWVYRGYFSNDQTANRNLIRLLTEIVEINPQIFHDYGIISNQGEWNAIFGTDFEAFGDKSLLWLNKDKNPDVYKGFVTFGGWKSAIGKIYDQGTKCNNKDLNLIKWNQTVISCPNSKVTCPIGNKCCQHGPVKTPLVNCCPSTSTCCSVTSPARIGWCCSGKTPKCGTTQGSCKS